MDTQISGSVDARPDDGLYLRRAQALLAARTELFLTGPARAARLAGVAVPPTARSGRLGPVSRQLTLPLPREHGRRRARMVR